MDWVWDYKGERGIKRDTWISDLQRFHRLIFWIEANYILRNEQAIFG